MSRATVEEAVATVGICIAEACIQFSVAVDFETGVYEYAQAFSLRATPGLYKRSVTERRVEPHYLLLNPPVWYAVCWDHLRAANRTFRCDRMADAHVTEQTFDLRNWAWFEADQAGNPTREA